ncbi:molecular chaperone DnaJ [Candidatus Phytoplasma luffae]|uniref:Chaperone protein DnaJ n=1 Tax=Loofah witches'-broom phytoplasma TaxID=35773 RepID=A0A975FIV6_LOWBP|nr:molecular chaperone DnaJ [Candidatus Phytoplasma luffae]QTX02592.1 molecular chaperone DnaJ [Candidatus Phytoplasma luffae]
MDVKRDYYEILGISRNASQDEIKQAYRKLVKKYHPDVSKEANASEKFKEVQEAYQILNDSQKRSNYDRFGHQDNYNNFGGGSGFQDFSDGFDFGDIFENFFGNQRQSQTRQRQNYAEDTTIRIEIEFLEACLGVKKIIKFQIKEDCSQCHGIGAENPQDVENCSHCNGLGYIKVNQKFLFNNITTQQMCPYCRGQGQKINKKCSRCKGSKRVFNEKELEISIPAGVEDGMTLKVPNQGNIGHLGAKNSDLLINISVRSHKTFIREDQNILSTFFINYYDAILGNTFVVDTIYGEVYLKIPSGTQSHTQFKLKNKGIPYLNSSYRKGDHYITVKVTIPTKLTSHEKKLIEQIKEIDSSKQNIKKDKSWFF